MMWQGVPRVRGLVYEETVELRRLGVKTNVWFNQQS